MGLFFVSLFTAVWVPLLTALVTIIANSSYQVSVIATNAYLPDMALLEVERKGEDPEESPSHERATERQSLIHKEFSEDKVKLVTARLSSLNMAFGGISALSGAIALEVYLASSTDTDRRLLLACGLIGVWWALFAIPQWLFLPSGERTGSISLLSGWKRIGELLVPSKIQRLSNLFTFLLVWLLSCEGKSIAIKQLQY